ncbi:MAG: SDR family NAD(P)-dependent oxidoreductase [Eubacteriales bacterium]|nr:SDR family NAD(P)-dependent oxidoreductase [Eubacteriales bacterium]MDD4422052.1 SDR family NAD(P)-dependent oxidoreductase [Eubacteriales bacterium]
MKTAIITGASSGLGMEYFKVLTEICPEIEEFWLIARREDKLTALASANPKVKSFVLPVDLTEKESLLTYEKYLAEKKPEVTILINNAGFGKLGDVMELPVFEQRDMVMLNCAALTAISLMTAPYMEKGSCIIQVSSIAAFSPTPRMSVYSATKAYVLAFAKALRRELRKSGVNVLAVCPGPMETEFTAVAEIDGKPSLFSVLPRCDVRQVALKSIMKARKGRGVYTNRLIYKVYRVLTKLLPDSITMRRL